MSIQCPACLTLNSDIEISCKICGCVLHYDAQQAHQSAPLHLAAGALLKKGQYRVEKTLGEGGFGITYKASNLTSNRQVAIKELLPEKSARRGCTFVWSPQITPQQKREQIEAVKREAENLAKCNHPNIVKVNDYFEENETAYIVMELISGKSLAAIFKEHSPLPEKMVKQYFTQVVEALKIIHTQNLLHRDINPNNILINQNDQAVLIDFGNAREFIAGQSRDMTRTVTPGYAPLEQYSVRGSRGPSTDLYAVCATIYELLTGVLPPEPTERLRSETLIPPRQLVPHISAALEQIILDGMKIHAADRFQSADELVNALSPSPERARRLAAQGNLVEAAQTYDRCLADEPNNSLIVIEKALIFIYLDDRQAEVAAKQAIQLKASDGRSFGILGLVYCRSTNWPDAIRHLQQALNLSADQGWIRANYAWALGMSRKWIEADVEAVKAINHCNNFITSNNNQNLCFALGLRSWVAVHRQDWKLAIPTARQAIHQSKQLSGPLKQSLQSWIYPCLTVALDTALSSRQTSDIERCIQEFITQVPDSAFAWGFKAWKDASQGFWSRAVQHFEVALLKAGIPAWVYKNQGVIYEHLKDSQKAIQIYETAYQQYPDDTFIPFRIGTLLGQAGKWIQARPYLEKAIQLKPDYAEANHNLGWVLLNIRKQDHQAKVLHEIQQCYRKAFELYSRQGRVDLAQTIATEFQFIGIDL